MRHPHLRLAGSPLPGSRSSRMPPGLSGGTRRAQLKLVDVRPSAPRVQPEHQRAKRRLAELAGWVRDPNAWGLVSFLHVCVELGLDATRIRRILR